MGHTRALLKAFLVVMAAETARSFGFGELSVAIEAATESVTEAATQSATESVTESTTESSRAFVTYDVLSTIVNLMDAKDFSGLKTFTFSSENVRPIHRKDLNEVAYFEITDGSNYYVFSAGHITGDYSLVQHGNGTRPTEKLNNCALSHSERCERYYRITASSGLYVCENAENRLVASTFDFVSDAPVDCVNLQNETNWNHLHTFLHTNLSEFNKEWQELYNETRDPCDTEILTTDLQKDANIASYPEEAICPGSSVKTALGNQFSNLSIQITGTRGNANNNETLDEWQTRLCQVLGNLCVNGSTEVNKEVIQKTPNGISYIRLTVSEDEDSVSEILNNTEVQFVTEFQSVEGEQEILVRKIFAIAQSSCPNSSWSAWNTTCIPHEHLFPDYGQRKIGGCWSGCGPVAWAQVFGYYDRLAHAIENSGFSKCLYRCDEGHLGSPNCIAPSKTTPTVQKYVEYIRTLVDTFCLLGGGATTQRFAEIHITYERKI